MAGDQRILGLVLAGSPGTRLAPLTADRAKPAVPFGGMYRLVDFALSNLANAGIYRISGAGSTFVLELPAIEDALSKS